MKHPSNEGFSEDVQRYMELFPILSMLNQGKISDATKENPGFLEYLTPFEPFESASLISGLLTEPSYHANTIRLELLIQLLIAYCDGVNIPKAKRIEYWLNDALGKTNFVLLEDPPEDVFISNVTDFTGNFRIFEGVWERNDFGLQRILKITTTFPPNEPFQKLRKESLALLSLSEEVAKRCCLPRYILGSGRQKSNIELPNYLKIIDRSKNVRFSLGDIKALGFSPEDLSPFVFDLNKCKELREQQLGDNELLRHPLLLKNNEYLVALPSAISMAIRLHILDWIIKEGYHDAIDNFLVEEYRYFLGRTSIFGKSIQVGIPIPHQKCRNKYLLCLSREFDSGHYVQIICIIDGIMGYKSKGFFEPDPEDGIALAEAIDELIKKYYENVKNQKGFLEGLTIIVMCGYGRAEAVPLKKDPENWKVISLSAADFETISQLSELSPHVLWKLLKQKDFIEKNGVNIICPNGIFNLFSWWRQCDYYLIPQQMEFAGGPQSLMIPPNAILQSRKETRERLDVHSLPYINGKYIEVMRKSITSYFPTDLNKRHYVSLDSPRNGILLGVWEGNNNAWWIQSESSCSRIDKSLEYQTWEAVCNWCEYSVPIFEKFIPKINAYAILIILDFNKCIKDINNLIPEKRPQDFLLIETDSEKNIITLTFQDSFFGGFINSKNIAERAIIRAMSKGVMQLAGMSFSESDINYLENKIVPSDDARFLHLYNYNISFQDYIKSADKPKQLILDDADVAQGQLGLGWIIQKDRSKYLFLEPEESCKLIKSCVEEILKRIRVKLKKIDRYSLINLALRSIVGNDMERQRWEHTIKANHALRRDRQIVTKVAGEYTSLLSSSNIALRIIIEMAVCKCPEKGGRQAGWIELQSLMADAFLVFNLGESSDTIYKGVSKPNIEIAPNGIVRTNIEFRKYIGEPMARDLISYGLKIEEERYESRFNPSIHYSEESKIFDNVFCTAFNAEFGLAIDDLRKARDILSELGLAKGECVFMVTKDEIITLFEEKDGWTAEKTSVFLNRFSLHPRDPWETPPKGFDKKDIFPWRFGRNLSLTHRPIVHLGNGKYLISPSILEETVPFLIMRYYEGISDPLMCKSRQMKSWIDKERNHRSDEFEERTSNVMSELGYNTRLGGNVRSILEEKTEKDFGDVDVLAWKKGKQIVYAIECKALNMAITAFEIAEHLNRFSGKLKMNGKPDELLKHIQRCEYLQEKADRLSSRLGILEPISIQPVVCFSRLTPMRYVWEKFPEIMFCTLDQLKNTIIKKEQPSD